MKKIFLLSVALITLLLTSCTTQRISTIVGGEYDAAKDVTEYFVVPFGSTKLPGKWEKIGYNNVSHQQFFKNSDGVTVAVVLGLCNKYEFNEDGLLHGFDFAKSFYEWESEYFKSQGFSSSLIESDKVNDFVVFRIYGKDCDTYFLTCEKNGRIGSFSVNYTDKWSESEKIEFLKILYREFTEKN